MGNEIQARGHGMPVGDVVDGREVIWRRTEDPAARTPLSPGEWLAMITMRRYGGPDGIRREAERMRAEKEAAR